MPKSSPNRKDSISLLYQFILKSVASVRSRLKEMPTSLLLELLAVKR